MQVLAALKFPKRKNRVWQISAFAGIYWIGMTWLNVHTEAKLPSKQAIFSLDPVKRFEYANFVILSNIIEIDILQKKYYYGYESRLRMEILYKAYIFVKSLLCRKNAKDAKKHCRSLIESMDYSSFEERIIKEPRTLEQKLLHQSRDGRQICLESHKSLIESADYHNFEKQIFAKVRYPK